MCIASTTILYFRPLSISIIIVQFSEFEFVFCTEAILNLLKLIITSLHFILESVGNGTISDASVPRLRKFSRDVLLHIQRQYSGKTAPIGKRGSTFPNSASRVSFDFSFYKQV